MGTVICRLQDGQRTSSPTISSCACNCLPHSHWKRIMVRPDEQFCRFSLQPRESVTHLAALSSIRETALLNSPSIVHDGHDYRSLFDVRTQL